MSNPNTRLPQTHGDGSEFTADEVAAVALWVRTDPGEHAVKVTYLEGPDTVTVRGLLHKASAALVHFVPQAAPEAIVDMAQSIQFGPGKKGLLGVLALVGAPAPNAGADGGAINALVAVMAESNRIMVDSQARAVEAAATAAQEMRAQVAKATSEAAESAKLLREALQAQQDTSKAYLRREDARHATVSTHAEELRGSRTELGIRKTQINFHFPSFESTKWHGMRTQEAIEIYDAVVEKSEKLLTGDKAHREAECKKLADGKVTEATPWVNMWMLHESLDRAVGFFIGLELVLLERKTPRRRERGATEVHRGGARTAQHHGGERGVDGKRKGKEFEGGGCVLELLRRQPRVDDRVPVCHPFWQEEEEEDEGDAVAGGGDARTPD